MVKSIILKGLVLISLLILALQVSSPVHAQDEFLYYYESIKSYDSDILINSDSSISVTETITVVALNEKINRGIFRDYPTQYKTKLGFNSRTSFEIVEILRDGKKENYRTEELSNGVRVYIGNDNHILTPGEYTYTIRYNSSRQITFFDNHDELFYNITGNGWEFPILSSSAKITIPVKLSDEQIEIGAYWGIQDSRNRDNIQFTTQFNDESTEVRFVNGNRLEPMEGFSTYVEFPKGIVYEMSREEELRLFLYENFSALLLIFSMVMIPNVAILLWLLKGRDPKGKAIYPQFKIPKYLSPGIARFIDKMGYDQTILVSTIASLGSKGILKVDELIKKKLLKKEKSYSISIINNDPTVYDKLSTDEQAFINAFFPSGTKKITFSNEYSATLKTASDIFSTHYDISYKNEYFTRNLSTVIMLVIYCLLAIAHYQLTVWFLNGDFSYINLLTFIGWNILYFALIIGDRAGNKDFGENWLINIPLKGSGIGIPIIAILVSFQFLSDTNRLILIPVLVVSALTIVASFFALKARTVKGREIQDLIEGLKMFIVATEEEKIKIMHKEFPKDLTMFNKYFPYALAFGLEASWTNQFEKVIKEAQVLNENGSYSLGWYAGMNSFSPSSFSSSISNGLNSTISSSSTPPSSSGGGFSGGSGGGGGGGGGGGW